MPANETFPKDLIEKKSMCPNCQNLVTKIGQPNSLAKESSVESFNPFKNCVCIIDCTETYIERPFNLNVRAQTFSDYKSHNTMKYLIGITPASVVSFLLAGSGGRASDK